MVPVTASNNQLVGVKVRMISPAISPTKILRGKQGTRKELMSQTKAVSAHFPNTPRRRVRACVTQGVTCNHDGQVPTPVEERFRRYRCRKPFKLPWNYPRGKSESCSRSRDAIFQRSISAHYIPLAQYKHNIRTDLFSHPSVRNNARTTRSRSGWNPRIGNHGFSCQSFRDLRILSNKKTAD
jgi:hypothetical protein